MTSESSSPVPSLSLAGSCHLVLSLHVQSHLSSLSGNICPLNQAFWGHSLSFLSCPTSLYTLVFHLGVCGQIHFKGHPKKGGSQVFETMEHVFNRLSTDFKNSFKGILTSCSFGHLSKTWTYSIWKEHHLDPIFLLSFVLLYSFCVCPCTYVM